MPANTFELCMFMNENVRRAGYFFLSALLLRISWRCSFPISLSLLLSREFQTRIIADQTFAEPTQVGRTLRLLRECPGNVDVCQQRSTAHVQKLGGYYKRKYSNTLWGVTDPCASMKTRRLDGLTKHSLV